MTGEVKRGDAETHDGRARETDAPGETHDTPQYATALGGQTYMNQNDKPKFVIVVDDETRTKLVGFRSEIPLPLAFAVLDATPDAMGEAPFNFAIKTASEMGLTATPAPGKRPAPMAALRTRAECPIVNGVTPDAGEVGAMLSILSERISARGGK